MPAERLSMRRVREILRLSHLGLKAREIASSLQMPPTTVGSYLLLARGANLSWPLPEEIDDAALEKALFVSKREQRPSRPEPDYTWVHNELRRKHVTLALLWQEYKAEHPDGYQYTQFCTGYRLWSGTLAVWCSGPPCARRFWLFHSALRAGNGQVPERQFSACLRRDPTLRGLLT